MTEESKLIKKVQQGDINAFATLVDANKNMVYSLVLRMMDHREDAEEVAQDTFLKAFQSIKQFKGNSKFSTWLYSIACFTAINHLRKHKKLNTKTDWEAIKNNDPSSLETLNNNDQKKIITDALKYLKPIERNLISLFYLEELSIKEVQEITGLKESNIKVNLMRIRKKMYGIINNMLGKEAATLINS